MEDHSGLDCIPHQTFLKERQMQIGHMAAVIGGGDARRGINLAGARQTFLLVIRPVFREAGNGQNHGLPRRFQNQAGRFIDIAVCHRRVVLGRLIALGKIKRLLIDDPHVPGNVPQPDRVAGADPVDGVLLGMACGLDQAVVIVPAQHPFAGGSALAFGRDGVKDVLLGGDGAQRLAVQINFIQIIHALGGKMPVPVHQARQHDVPLQVHLLVRRHVEIAAGFGRGLIAHECNLAALDGHHFSGFGAVRAQTLEPAEVKFVLVIQQIRHGVDFAPIVHRVHVRRGRGGHKGGSPQQADQGRQRRGMLFQRTLHTFSPQ